MKLKAFQKTTLVDYPGKVATTVFTVGCNFRCCFCHNPDLLSEGEDITEKKFFDFLSERKGLIEGVCITGGEPTIQPDLIDFIEKIKKEGFLVKLDTNGSHPEVLKNLAGKVDYIAMDIKCLPERYPEVCGFDFVPESVDLVKRCRDYEFRTTAVPGIVDEEVVEKIGQLLKGSKAYFLQQFRNEKTLNEEWRKVRPYPEERLKEMIKIAEPYFEKTGVR